MSDADEQKKHFWSTLEEWEGDPGLEQIRQEEFFSKPQAFFEAAQSQPVTLLNRRTMLKMTGAGMLFAAAACARRPVQKIVPYLNAPEEIIPGNAVWYASTCGCPAGCGVLVKTREGRPIKLEGNPRHPLNRGRLSARCQAAVWDLYDPDRLSGPTQVFRSKLPAAPLDWKTADARIAEALKSANGRVVLLTGTLHGPARERLIADFLASFPGARHITYDALSEEQIADAQETCYGKPVVPRYRFNLAETVVFLGADPLASGHSVTEFAAGFGDRRKVQNGSMSRVIAFEPALSLSGSNADSHFLVKPEDLLPVALGLAHQLVIAEGKSAYARDPMVRSALAPFAPEKVERETGLPAGTLRSVAADLWNARGKSLIYTGGLATQTGNGTALHIAANFLNSLLENEGTTVDGTQSPSHQTRGSQAAMLELIADLQAGKVDVLLIYGTNPAYSLPPSAGLAQALYRVKLAVSLNDRIDETGALCDYVLPSLHFLESWGDAEPQKGLFSLTQPAIGPLHDTRGFEESLLALARQAGAGNLGKWAGTWHDYLKETWQKEIHAKNNIAAGFEDFWTSALREGVFDTVSREEARRAPRPFNTRALSSVRVSKTSAGDFRLVLYPPAMQYDGRTNNNTWLLEMPDPVSKICWDNYAAVAPQTARQLGLAESEVVTLTANGSSLDLPVHLQPGVHPQVLAVAVGWGREKVGRYGNKVGVNAFPLAALKENALHFSAIPVAVKKTGKKQSLACVQGHHYMESRPIIYAAALEEYRKNPTAGREAEEKLPSIWKAHEYTGYRWGMAIDLNSCIGCNACMVACQAENNVAVVGKAEVLKGREMHWIRIDRYFSGHPDHPEVVHQPMLCQHCEQAPCETVCPTLATVHNEEGLNLQIYNRCVGTRYCSNNCPYKVRRFNWYENFWNIPTPLELVLNPDVTVREKGVMEKCTFCIQRIREGKEKAKEKGIAVADGDIQTACQQTCPTRAIVFGDINDPDSAVSKMSRDPRGYHVLEILNTKPSIAYLTKIRNRRGNGAA